MIRGSTEVPMTIASVRGMVRGGVLALLALSLPPAPGAAQDLPASARLRAGAAVPLAPTMAIGGGDVLLDVTVGTDGSVSHIETLRATPPYTDLVAGAVQGWRFDPARGSVRGIVQAVDGHVLVAAVFRPPDVYAAPSRGEPTAVLGEPSAELPRLRSLDRPLTYPPRSVRDGTVLVEIELTAAAVAREHRVMSPPSTFDSAALETVRGWRWDYPREPTGAPLFVYAVIGFREPITP
jgi:outer membrane biosynthesis protein TonB